MDEETIKAFANIVETSLQKETGSKWLDMTHANLWRAFGEHSFNTERAIEMYSIAIERAVLSNLGRALGVTTITTLRESGITHKMATELTDQFKEASSATDQRPPRKGIWAMIVGK
jgi:hypothetical protein